MTDDDELKFDHDAARPRKCTGDAFIRRLLMSIDVVARCRNRRLDNLGLNQSRRGSNHLDF